MKDFWSDVIRSSYCRVCLVMKQFYYRSCISLTWDQLWFAIQFFYQSDILIAYFWSVGKCCDCKQSLLNLSIEWRSRGDRKESINKNFKALLTRWQVGDSFSFSPVLKIHIKHFFNKIASKFWFDKFVWGRG